MKRANFALGSLVGFAVAWAGCSQQASTVPVRSLERSGKATFLCLQDRSITPGQELDGCLPTAIIGPDDYSSPHVVALVTQTARGEVAVIDVTAQTVLDTNAAIPGYNFLPVGALPTDIAATPRSSASFVAIADPLRPGIFAIPSSRLPYQGLSQPATLASWPACSLDGVDEVPTELVVVPDYTGMRPGRCDPSLPTAVPSPGYDLSSETPVFGRLKIVAVLPDRGELVVIDAQELLARAPGTYDRCPIEQTLVLQTLLPSVAAADAGAPLSDGSSSDGTTTDDATSAGSGTEAGGAEAPDAGGGATVADATCSGRVAPSVPLGAPPHPVSLALSDDGRLFVSDDRAPVIHVVDVSDPCSISEKPPLLPFSLSDPTRAVVTNAIAVSSLTTDQKRFVYAVDARGGGNVMAFDVTSDASDRRPIVLRPDVVYNPFEPRDRINFGAPVQDLTFAKHDVVLGDPSTSGGVVPRGIKCDPTVTDADTTNPAYPYRIVGFDALAGPRRLRGTFGFAALSSGRVGIVDVDDLDGPCRRPALSDDLAVGCDGDPAPTFSRPSASGEASCHVIERHQPRSGQYFANATNAGLHAPAMQAFPLLYDDQGALLSNDRARADSLAHPRLLGPSLVGRKPETSALLASVIGSIAIPEDASNQLSSDPTKALRNWVAFDLREPRAHYGQEWDVTFEGILPPLAAREGRLRCAANKTTACEGGDEPSNFILVDPSIGFCDQGAQGAALSRQVLGVSADATSIIGDIVQIVEPLPDPADPYWGTVASTCSPTACQSAYGPPELPTSGRDLEVDTSFQDRLVLKSNPDRALGAPLECCFPYPTSYNVRVGRHWLVTGQATGYAHHVIPDPTAPDPTTARCILSCDSSLRLRNSRVMEQLSIDPTTKMPSKIPSFDDVEDPRMFKNAQIRFVLWRADNCTANPCVTRDTKFTFVESGGFASIEVQLAAGAVLPQSIRFVRGIDQLAIPDAVSQGLMLFDLNTLSLSKAYF